MALLRFIARKLDPLPSLLDSTAKKKSHARPGSIFVIAQLNCCALPRHEAGLACVSVSIDIVGRHGPLALALSTHEPCAVQNAGGAGPLHRCCCTVYLRGSGWGRSTFANSL